MIKNSLLCYCILVNNFFFLFKKGIDYLAYFISNIVLKIVVK